VTTGPLAAFDDPSRAGPCDAVVVTVKAWQVAPIAVSLAPLVAAGGFVVPVQNGVEAAEQLAAALGEEAVIGAVCHVLATREGPARVHVAGAPLHLTLGERSGGSSPRIERFAEVVRGAGMTASLSRDVRVAVWSKLLFVEPFGSVGAVTRTSIDVVRAIPETRALLEAAMREVAAVAVGCGVRLPDDAVSKAMARVDAMPEGATASMHRDLVEGRPSELSEQTGAVVRLGERAGVLRPVHDVLWASLLPQERQASHRRRAASSSDPRASA
jgi:2-dehydropantoate 2-reductase